MSVGPLRAAKHLCEQSDWTLTNLQVQKMLYIAHMFYMGETGTPLISEPFEAWEYGPVERPLYHKVKMFGGGPIRNVFRATPGLGNEPEGEALSEAYEALKDWTPGQLVAFTHRRNGAWDRNYRSGEHHIVIPDEDILAEYQRFHANG